MGLFSNNKKLCPICGSPTPRFLATKFENEAICKDCDNKIDLPDGVQGKMTLADFRQYIARYDESRSAEQLFKDIPNQLRFSQRISSGGRGPRPVPPEGQ